MENLANIDLAYEFLRKQKKPVKLMAVWDGIKKNAINHKNDENEAIADLYSEMVLDVRFAVSPKGEWALSEDGKIEDIKKKFIDAKPSKPKKQVSEDETDLVDEDEDENPEIYDDLFVEEEDEDDQTVFYDEDEE